MVRKPINASDAPGVSGHYSQAVELIGATRLLFISGQVPIARDGTVPETFREQCLAAWGNLEAQLRAAGMGLSHLVKVTTYLADRAHALENRAVRQEVLGAIAPALTVIIADIFDEAWMIEIEAVAAG
jgi:2-iminobutanoate/2-iminopropanoate deaminase